MTENKDKASMVRAMVRGKILVAFETALQDVRTTEKGETVKISLNYFDKALEIITDNDFPWCALKNQRLRIYWITFKPSKKYHRV
jgi:hypothetical protein